MSTLQVTQEGVLTVEHIGQPTETYTLRSPSGLKWDLVANGTNGDLTATDSSVNPDAPLALFDVNETPWQVTMSDDGILTVESFDQFIALAPAVNAPISLNGLPAAGYELLATDSLTGLGATTYKNGLLIDVQPTPVVLNEFGLPTDAIYLIVGNAYTFQLFPPGGGAAVKTWTHVIGGIPLNTDLATQWLAPITAVYVSPTACSLQGDARAVFVVGRRVLALDASQIHGIITGVTYDGEKTVLELAMDSTTLTVALTAVQLALLSPRSAPMPSRRYNGKAITTSGDVVIPSPHGLNLLPVGTLALYPNTVILPSPQGWLVCGGQAISRTTYDELFAAVGTTFGTGDGSTTFNVPNLAAVATHLIYYIYAKE